MHSLTIDFTEAVKDPSDVVVEWRKRHQAAVEAKRNLEAVQAAHEAAQANLRQADQELVVALAEDQVDGKLVAGKLTAKARKAEEKLSEARKVAEEPWQQRVRAAQVVADDLRADAQRFASEHNHELVEALYPAILENADELTEAAQRLGLLIKDRMKRERELTVALGFFPLGVRRAARPPDPLTKAMRVAVAELAELPPRLPNVPAPA
jgi:hypothetical protein